MYCLCLNERLISLSIIQGDGLGEKKIRRLVDEYIDYGFVLQNGCKVLIKRKKFEEFMNETSAV